MGYENSAGLGNRNHYGPRTVNNKFGGKLPGNGALRTAEWVFTYDDLPAASTLNMELLIPDNAVIIDAYWETIETFAGGTSYDIDMVDTAGAAIGTGTDKLWDALLLATINAVGERSQSSTHTGTNSGNALNVAITEPCQLAVAATGTFTSGKARIVIEYMDAKPV